MLVGRQNNVLQVWEAGSEWEGSSLQAFLSQFEHGMNVRLAFKPEENHTIIGSRATKHKSANGRTEINLAYTITMPDGEVVDQG